MFPNRRALALVLFALITVCVPARAQSKQKVDLLVTNGTVVTMDAKRNVMENGAVAISVEDNGHGLPLDTWIRFIVWTIIGLLIYSKYVYGFEVAGIILLVGIIAAVALTLRKRKDTKHFHASDAVRVKRNDRLRIVLEGTNARASAGKAPKEIGDLLHQTTVRLFEQALTLMETA